MKTRLAVMMAVLWGVAGCTIVTHPVPVAQTTTRQTVTQAFNPSINATDFDLGTVTGMITGGQLRDLDTLQQKINDPASGINNVDVDKDNKVDYVALRESNSGGTELIEFMAYPSSNPSADPVLVASVRVATDTTTNRVTVNAAYPTYVTGYQQYGYSYVHPGLSFGDAVLLGYLLRPHTYYSPVYSRSYVARPVVVGSSLQSTRSSFQTTTRVAPVPRTTVSSSYQQPPSASRVTGSSAAVPNRTGTITGNAQQMRSFQARQPGASNPTGSSFSSRPPTRPVVAAPPPAPVRVSTVPSRPMSAPRSSFGGGRRR